MSTALAGAAATGLMAMYVHYERIIRVMVTPKLLIIPGGYLTILLQTKQNKAFGY